MSYAVESRRRVKEQMNKRKPDDEFTNISLSYTNSSGDDVVVSCPESQNAPATQTPARKRLHRNEAEVPAPPVEPLPERTSEPAYLAPALVPAPAPAPVSVATVAAVPEAPKEQHYEIMYGDVGHTYESVIGPYLPGCKAVVIEDPYIRVPYQVQNFARFCEVLVKASTVTTVKLVTSSGAPGQRAEAEEKLDEIRQSLLELDIALDVEFNENLHDREIRLDNGWIIKIGRGLDFYQPPRGWLDIGANDLSLRKCLETKVDIFHVEGGE